MAARILSRDMNKRSSFESAMVSQNSGMGSYMQKQGFKGKDYAGNTKYRTPKTLQQHTYAGASDYNRLARQTFREGKDQSRLASGQYQTDAAREGSRTARQQGQTFAAADDVFKTGSVRDAARSQAENKRPLIVKPDGGMADETPYTEDQIRRMVNRR